MNERAVPKLPAPMTAARMLHLRLRPKGDEPTAAGWHGQMTGAQGRAILRAMRLLLVAWASLAAACGCAAGPTATGPWLQQTGAREATVLWRTEEPAIGRVAWSAD